MTIEAQVRKQVLIGLACALNQTRKGAALVGKWSLEQKSSFEICGWRGACWTHGVDASSWPKMAAEAAKEGRSMYDHSTECYPNKGEIYFGSGQAEHDGEALQLRAHITHTLSSDNHMYVCVVWVKGSEGTTTVAKCAAGLSACYEPTEFHKLDLEKMEKDLPPPYEIDFK